VNDWPLAVDRLGVELQSALVRRQRRVRRLQRLLPVGLLLAFAIATAAGATNGLITQGIPVPWGGDAAHRAVVPMPLEPLRAADPEGGQAWGLRLAAAGPVMCQAVGQVVGGRIGVIRGRVFHALPPAYRGSCARVPDRGAVVRWDQYPGPNVGRHGARTVVHGLAGDGVIAVSVGEAQVARRLPLSPRGGFIGAFGGLRSPSQLPVRVTLANGDTKTYRGGSR
jgi:hypothetical protein